MLALVRTQIHHFYGYPWTPGSTSRFGPSSRFVEIFNFLSRPSEIKWVLKCVWQLVTCVPTQIHHFYGYPLTPCSTSRFGPSRRFVEIFNFLLRPSEIKWVFKSWRLLNKNFLPFSIQISLPVFYNQCMIGRRFSNLREGAMPASLSYILLQWCL